MKNLNGRKKTTSRIFGLFDTAHDPRDCQYRIENICNCPPDECEEIEWFEDEEEEKMVASDILHSSELLESNNQLRLKRLEAVLRAAKQAKDPHIKRLWQQHVAYFRRQSRQERLVRKRFAQ